MSDSTAYTSGSDLARAARRVTRADFLMTLDHFDGDACVTEVGIAGAGVSYAPMALGRGVDRSAARAAALGELLRAVALFPILHAAVRLSLTPHALSRP